MHDVFVSHVEEDAVLAIEIVLGLETTGYETWCYEYNTVPGISYLIQTGHAIENCRVLVVLISPEAIGSRQMTKEIVRAHECNRHFLPVLRNVSHVEFQTREPEWREALGAAASIRLTEKGVAAALPRIIEGLKGLGVHPTGPHDPARIASIRETLQELKKERLGSVPDAELGSRVDKDHPGPGRGGTFAQTSRPWPQSIRPPQWLGGGGRMPRSDRARLLRRTLFGLVAGLVTLFVAAFLWFLETGDRSLIRSRAPDEREPLVVGVMGLVPYGTHPDLVWMSQNTRDSLNTILSKVSELRVYAKEIIDFKREKGGLGEIEAAQELGISKMISGTLSMTDSGLMLEVRVVDMATGFLEASFPRRQNKDRLIELQNEAAVEVLRVLKIPMTPERKGFLLAHRTNDTLDAYNLLYGTLGDFSEEEKEPAGAPPTEPRSGRSFHWRTTVAYAQEGGPIANGGQAGAEAAEKTAIRQLLEQYKAALEAKDIKQLAAIHVKMSKRQRDAQQRYFDNADELRVEISNVYVLIEGNEAVATFTREDAFRDVRSGREMRLEVRLSSLLAKDNGRWKISGLKRPS